MVHYLGTAPSIPKLKVWCLTSWLVVVIGGSGGIRTPKAFSQAILSRSCSPVPTQTHVAKHQSIMPCIYLIERKGYRLSAGGENEIRTHVTHSCTIGLANQPLQPLEYFSM